jgi:hypothetical protein
MCEVEVPQKGCPLPETRIVPLVTNYSDSQCRNVSILASYLRFPDALRLSFRQEGSTFTWVVVSCVELDKTETTGSGVRER